MGDDNTFKKGKKDIKELNRDLRRLSPENELLHFHMLYRVNSYYPGEDMTVRFPSQKLVSELWDKIHGAKIVYVAFPENVKDCIDYTTKHIVKEYPITSKLGFRPLVSKGWLPGGWQIVRRIICKATMDSINKGKPKEDAWKLMGLMVDGWLRGQATIQFKMNSETISIQHKFVFTKNGVYDLKVYAEKIGIKKPEENEKD
jgi:hypothetical protein